MSASRRPVSFIYPAGNHRALAEHWGNQCVLMIQRAIADPISPVEDFYLLHAIRCARIAASHAFRAYPRLERRTTT